MLMEKTENKSKVSKFVSSKRLFIISGIVLILIVVGTSVWFSRKGNQNIKTQPVSKHDLKEIIDVSGAVESEQDIIIKSVASGIIINRFIQENFRVGNKTPLLVIDPQQQKLHLNQAQVNALAGRMQAETELANAQKALVDAEARHKLNVEQIENQIDKSESAIKFLEKEVIRNQKLLQQEAIPKQTIDNQKQQLEQAKIDLQTVISNIQKVKDEKGEITAAQNRVNQSRTALNNSIKQGEASISIAKDTLQRTTIYAPFSGTITRWIINNGDYVSPGMSLARFQDLEQLRLKLPINELDLPKIRLNDPVNIVFDAYPEKIYHGIITWISESSVIDNENVQTFPVKVKFDNPKHLIKPGMSGDAQITVSERKGVISIPINSIHKQDSKIMVNILENNKPKEVEIKPGFSTLEYLEVRSGLKPGDQLIIEEEKNK